jgi:hypothetical protein
MDAMLMRMMGWRHLLRMLRRGGLKWCTLRGAPAYQASHQPVRFREGYQVQSTAELGGKTTKQLHNEKFYNVHKCAMNKFYA